MFLATIMKIELLTSEYVLRLKNGHFSGTPCKNGVFGSFPPTLTSNMSKSAQNVQNVVSYSEVILSRQQHCGDKSYHRFTFSTPNMGCYNTYPQN